MTSVVKIVVTAPDALAVSDIVNADVSIWAADNVVAEPLHEAENPPEVTEFILAQSADESIKIFSVIAEVNVTVHSKSSVIAGEIVTVYNAPT